MSKDAKVRLRKKWRERERARKIPFSASSEMKCMFHVQRTELECNSEHHIGMKRKSFSSLNESNINTLVLMSSSTSTSLYSRVERHAQRTSNTCSQSQRSHRRTHSWSCVCDGMCDSSELEGICARIRLVHRQLFESHHGKARERSALIYTQTRTYHSVWVETLTQSVPTRSIIAISFVSLWVNVVIETSILCRCSSENGLFCEEKKKHFLCWKKISWNYLRKTIEFIERKKIKKLN